MPTNAELVTPERVLFSGEGEFVVLRADGGEIMFLPDHAPFIAAVDISVLRIAPPEGESGEEFRAAVHGGFVRVAGNLVQVLASVAEVAGEIDVPRARRAMEAAEAAIAAGEGEAGSGSGSGASSSAAAASAAAGGPDGESVEEQEQSPVMKALLFPDDPEVALRRAQARLEAAGELESATAASGSGSH